MSNSKNLTVTPIGLIQDNFFSQFTGKKYSGLLITGTYFGSDSWDEYSKLYKQYENQGSLHPLTIIMGQTVNMDIKNKSENDGRVISTRGPISLRIPPTLIPSGILPKISSVPPRESSVLRTRSEFLKTISEPTVAEELVKKDDKSSDIASELSNDDESTVSSELSFSTTVSKPPTFSGKRYKLVDGDSTVYYRSYDSYLRNWQIADPITRGSQLKQ